MTTKPPPFESWGSFSEALRRKLEAGAREHPDSLERDPDDLLHELQMEALDLAGWGAVLWERIERLRAKLGNGGRQ